MEESELLEIIARGEDSKHQRKRGIDSAKLLGEEMAAFANSDGGRIFVGVDKDGTLCPLDPEGVERANQLISNAACDCVRPPIYPQTENVPVTDGVVIVISVPRRVGFPHFDRAGYIRVKDGSDKRRLTAPEEILRMFQSSGLAHADESPASGTSVADVDRQYFANFYLKRFDELPDDEEQAEKRFTDLLEQQQLSLQRLLANMRLLCDDMLTTTGVLLFGTNPHALIPAFHIKAVAYPDAEIDVENYLDSEDFTGKLEHQFKGAMGFLRRNLRKTQQGQGVNAPGEIEVPQIVFEELLANALIHRDFFVSAPIRMFIFNDRIEIISPGTLPNNLTVENILSGNSNMRNPTLASYATHILPYRGIGSGIVRARKAYADISFDNDTDGNKFAALIRRPTK